MKTNKYISKLTLHPIDKELADFIDNKLSSPKKEKIIEHLIYCDECTKIIINVIKNIKKK